MKQYIGIFEFILSSFFISFTNKIPSSKQRPELHLKIKNEANLMGSHPSLFHINYDTRLITSCLLASFSLRESKVPYFIGFFLIGAFYFFGIVTASLLPLPIPSSIISMLLLFLCLTLRIIPVHWVKDASMLLMKIMPLFFIPASLGIFEQADLLASNILPLLVGTLLSSLIVLIVTAKLIEKNQGEKA